MFDSDFSTLNVDYYILSSYSGFIHDLSSLKKMIEVGKMLSCAAKNVRKGNFTLPLSLLVYTRTIKSLLCLLPIVVDRV